MSGCRREGTIARLGGDEFTILPGSVIQQNDAIVLAARFSMFQCSVRLAHSCDRGALAFGSRQTAVQTAKL